jgi:thiol:disulfide interchange protein DsbD
MSVSESSLTLFGVFLLGLGLNLTPCVYPMISITVSLFRGHEQQAKHHAFIKAMVYVLGMSVIYSTLGVVTAFSGGLFGAALQNRWVLCGIGVLMLGMAASLFGFYILQAPQWLVKMASKRGTDLIGIFLSGLFVGVFAAPCIGPLIIALIAHVAQTGDPVYAFKIFFTMSLGLGLPYILLGTFAGLIHHLPKSGVWLVWVDRLFGTVLLSVAVFYFMLAFNAELLPWLVPGSLVLGGIYLGFIEKSKNYSPSFLQFKKLAGVLAVTAGLAIIFFAPKQGVVWESYTAEKVAQAEQAGKPVIMDFYADWCIPCHELDQFTYTDPKVIKLLSDFVRLKVDLTNPTDPALEKLIEDMEILGVPTILFLDAKGKEVRGARVTGLIPADELIDILEKEVLTQNETGSQPSQSL